jgi:MHS family proline/betaine transporter-like MFS transporter
MHHHDPLVIMVGQLGFVAIVGTVSGTLPSVLIEASPVGIRCTAVALGFNLTAGIIGGLTPLAAAWLIHRTGQDLSPAFMLTGAAALSLFTLSFYRETFREPFEANVATAAA